MIIRKLFKFEGAHVVRNCHTAKCKFSVHGHSYRAEVLLSGYTLDDGQMLVDFTLVKRWLGDMIDAFDHTMLIWDQDNEDFVKDMVKHSKRYIILPVSPSAEQLSRLLLRWCSILAVRGCLADGYNPLDVKVTSVIVHETDTGYAQAGWDDITGRREHELKPSAATFSPDLLETYPILKALQETV